MRAAADQKEEGATKDTSEKQRAFDASLANAKAALQRATAAEQVVVEGDGLRIGWRITQAGGRVGRGEARPYLAGQAVFGSCESHGGACFVLTSRMPLG